MKNVRIRSFSAPYFPVFGLNRAIYEVDHRVQSEYRKTRISKNSVFGLFSRIAYYLMEIIFGHLLNVLFTLNLHLATTLKVSVFGVIMVSIFPHSNLLRGDTEYSSV